MSWIEVISYEEAEAPLKKIYDRIAGPGGSIDNVLQIHSLRPHSLIAHMTLYKNVLHHSANKLPKWYLEAVGIYVSHLNNCEYCVKHHLTGLAKLIGNSRAKAIWEEFESEDPGNSFNTREQAGMRYARMLTRSPQQMVEEEIDSLRHAGFDDGEILELNQVVSYFNYVNRTVLGLGVSLQGDILGLSPSGEDWSHH